MHREVAGIAAVLRTMAAHDLCGRLSRAAPHLHVAFAALKGGRGAVRLIRARLLLGKVAARCVLPPLLCRLLRGRLPLLPHLLLLLLLSPLLWLLLLPLLPWLLTLPLLLLLLLNCLMKALLSGPALGVLLLRGLLGSILALLLLLPRLLVHLLRLMIRWRVPLWAIPEGARLVQRW
jgi:hypothetical protein